MRKYWLRLTGVVLALAVIGLAGCAGGASTGPTNSQEGLWVSGEGKVFVAPDIATLSLGVSAQSTSVADAQSQAAGAMDKVMKALTDDGVADEDIQTQQFSIVQVTRWDDKTQQEIVIGYRVTNVVTAKIRDTDLVGLIIDDVAEAGGDLTRINSVDFSVEDPSLYNAEARQKAVADARAKASQLAELFGVKLGDLIYVTESAQYPPIIRGGTFEQVTPGVAPTPISPGQVELTLNVQAVYAIR